MRLPLSRRLLLAGAAALLSAAGRAAESGQPAEVDPGFAAVFADAKVSGTFAVLDLNRQRLRAAEAQRVRQGFLPASTFKIPNALIALQTGAVSGVDTETFKWDGTRRSIEAWNRDHTLRTAFQASAVPVFQAIARRIGAESMRRFVDAFAYGNRSIAGAPIDRFWLEGDLRISALEQIGFLAKLYRGELPIDRRHQDAVKDIMLLESGELGVLRGKTGAVSAAAARNGGAMLGWLVGWLERGGDAHVFALNIDVWDGAGLAQRLPLAKALLALAVKS